MKLKGRVALITGAARGIGKDIACEFSREGADIVANYCHSEKQAGELETLMKRYTPKNARILTIYADVSKKEDIDRMADRALEVFGSVDILVNNAGTFERTDFFESDEETWNRTMETNLKGTMLCSQRIGKHMTERGYGKIINMGSAAGINAQFPVGIEYAVSKAGVIHFTKCLAGALAPHVNVNCIAPGYTSSDMTGYASNPEKRRDRERTIPLGRVNAPYDIAKLALFLASDDARNITGEVFIIDGGRRLYTGKP